MSDKVKKIIGTIAGVLILLLLYIVFLKPDNEQGVVGVETGRAAASLDGELLSLLNTLKSINYDTSLFESTAYRSLVDFSVIISPQPVGRSNPFAPVGVDGGFSGGTTEDLLEDEVEE